jgi:hypothetical protein
MSTARETRHHSNICADRHCPVPSITQTHSRLASPCEKSKNCAANSTQYLLHRTWLRKGETSSRKGKLRRPYCLNRRRVRLPMPRWRGRPSAPIEMRGRSAERRNQLRAHEARRAPWSGAHASRRSTAAMALVSLETITGSGPRFAGGFKPLRQRAPRGRLVVARRAEPRSRPGAWLRTTPAGAASRPAVTTPRESALSRTGRE